MARGHLHGEAKDDSGYQSSEFVRHEIGILRSPWIEPTLILALALFCRAQTSHPRREPGAANDVEIGEIDVPGEEDGASQVLVSRNRFYRGERQAGLAVAAPARAQRWSGCPDA